MSFAAAVKDDVWAPVTIRIVSTVRAMTTTGIKAFVRIERWSRNMAEPRARRGVEGRRFEWEGTARRRGACAASCLGRGNPARTLMSVTQTS